MKLTFSPASPFARKVRIAAIELGLIDKSSSSRRPWCRASPTTNIRKINPLKKLPALILDNGERHRAIPMSSSNISTSLPAAEN